MTSDTIPLTENVTMAVLCLNVIYYSAFLKMWNLRCRDYILPWKQVFLILSGLIQSQAIADQYLQQEQGPL